MEARRVSVELNVMLDSEDGGGGGGGGGGCDIEWRARVMLEVQTN